MPSIREALSGQSGCEVTPFAEKSKHGSSQTGASMQKRMLAFVPAAENEAFNGGLGKSFSYAYLYSIDFSRDYSALLLTFGGHQVRVTGRNLKSKLDQIEAFREELVEQADGLEAAGADPSACVVTGLELIDRTAQEEG